MPAPARTSLNRAGEQITGYSSEEILQMNISHISAPDCLALAHELRIRKMREGSVINYELDIITKDKKNLPQSHSPSFGWVAERMPLTSVK